MNLTECEEWTAACARSFQLKRPAALAEIVRRLAPSTGLGRWEIGIVSDAMATVELRFRGLDADYGSWIATASAVTGIPKGIGPMPQAPLPWVRFSWDFHAERMIEACLFFQSADSSRHYGQVRLGSALSKITLSEERYSSKEWAATPLESVLDSLNEHCAIQSVITQCSAGRKRKSAMSRWSLVFKRSIPWQRFAASDFAAPFSPQSTELTWCNLNYRIREISIGEGKICAYLGS